MGQEETILIHLDIPAEKYLSYYQGTTSAVVAKAQDGRRVRFPAAILRPFVTKKGIKGLFALRITPTGKLIGINRLAQ